MTKQEKTDFMLWLRSELKYWKKLMGIRARIVMRKEPKLTGTDTWMMLEFFDKQATILYDPALINEPKHKVSKAVIHELVHYLHQEADTPLYDYQMNNDSFRATYEASEKAIEKLCDQLANIIYAIGKPLT